VIKLLPAQSSRVSFLGLSTFRRECSFPRPRLKRSLKSSCPNPSPPLQQYQPMLDSPLRLEKEEKERLQTLLSSLMDKAQRSLVSLRKNDVYALFQNMDGLNDSIAGFMESPYGDEGPGLER
jgi:hypothetical protein